MAKHDRFLFVRLGAILALGGLAIALAALHTRARGRREPAPDAVQQAGMRLVDEVLATVGASEFGRSRRGTLLAAKVREFIRRHRLVFTAVLRSQALYRREAGGEDFLYVCVMPLGKRLVHLTKEQIAEALFHECVHASDASDESSIEEECG
ncbi:MAG: hypothetical protein ISS72_06200 [Candidatus Brocadiae bacterium]|nr:hypothetical protein [Candidatus Brocadiia bacterium]